MKQKQYTYLCTRPRLASMLISAGVRTTKVDNPFSDEGQHRKAWYADLNDTSVAIISEYYSSIGKPLPATVTAFLKEGAAE